jgi:hypothetical protein
MRQGTKKQDSTQMPVAEKSDSDNDSYVICAVSSPPDIALL